MTGRHISIKIRRELEWEFGQGCGFPGCKKPAMDLHHAKRFAIVNRHSEEEIVPLCKTHHELAHAGLIRGEESKVEGWEMDIEEKKNHAVARVDEKVMRERNRRKNEEKGGGGWTQRETQ